MPRLPMTNTKLVLIFGGLIVVLGAAFYLNKSSFTNISTTINVNKLQIATSFYPLYFFASQIGGDRVKVINVTPAGAEPHDYEPSTGDFAQIENSRLLLINGSGFEIWEKNIRDLLKNKQVEI